jgi:hypothetical protein
MTTSFSLSPKKITTLLLLLVFVLNAASFMGRLIEDVLGYTETTEVVRLVHVNREGNITTYYSALSLLFCGVLLFLITTIRKQVNDPYVRHWRILSYIFVYLSIDEAASIHEALVKPIRSVVSIEGFQLTAWIFIAIPALVVFVALYAKFLFAQPRRIRNLFLIGGIVFVYGAVVVESVGGYVLEVLYGQELLILGRAVSGRIVFALLLSVEEFLEMLGVAIFAYGLLVYLKMNLKAPEIELHVAPLR